MQQDYFAYLFQAINDVLNQNASQFEGMGMNLFRALAVILIAWFGIQSALHSASGGGAFSWAKLTSLLMQVVTVYVLLAFYTAPIPGLGVSFTHLVLDQVQSMTATLNVTSVQSIMETLDGVITNVPYPSPWEIMDITRFFVLLLAITAAQAVTLFVTMFGYVATAVIMLVGPVFIPFKLVPEMDWMFWGWLRSFIQFAFYQFIASAYVFVFGRFLEQVLGAKKTPLSGTDLAYLFVPLLLVLVTFILGIFKIPALTFSIFSGRSGDYIFPWWR